MCAGWRTHLQVARTGRFYGGVHQALPARHAVEVVVLRSQPREEPVGDVTARAWRRVERREAGQRFAGHHNRDATALQILTSSGGEGVGMGSEVETRCGDSGCEGEGGRGTCWPSPPTIIVWLTGEPFAPVPIISENLKGTARTR